MMQIKIDPHSGYCFGVEFAIQMAEDEISSDQPLYCLGDIVHNDMEVKRLTAKGLKIIKHSDLENIHDAKVLIRAHGEPPETYQLALKNNIELIDASCPVVLKLQSRIKNAYDRIQSRGGQIIIYGKKGHAEVIGLDGQTNQEAIIISSEKDLDKIDYTKPSVLFSQTTKSTDGFYKIKAAVENNYDKRMPNGSRDNFEAHDSICRQVSNREPRMKVFASENDIVLFVSGKKSSNGRALFAACQSINPRSYFIENKQEIDPAWFEEDDRVGICGATSTPMWLMESIAESIENMFHNQPTP
jgi:4-hydroxy-3-methylbut-2-enyl diphosphate reductase